MGKVKRTRQKLHTPSGAAKDKNEENKAAKEKQKGEDYADNKSLKKAGSVAASKVTSNIFKGVKITPDTLKQHLPDFDACSTVTSKSLRGLNLKKKDKQRIRHELWLQKMDAITAARKEKREKRRRKQAVIVGDLSAMADALPTLELLLKDASVSSSAREREETKPKGIPSEKQRQNQMMSDVSLFKQVLDHPAYKENPSATILEHLRNKLRQEEEMDT